MFADCMLETSWTQRAHRGWSTLTSFGLESIVIALLLLLPLWKTVGLPVSRALPTPISWGTPSPAVHSVARQQVATILQSNLADNVLIEPSHLPDHVAAISETVPPPQVSFNTGIGVEGAIGRGAPNGILDAINNSIAGAARPSAPPPPTVTRTFRESKLLEGSLIRRVVPVYPLLAKTARIQGPVVLFAIIGKTGTIQNLRVLSGHPMLVSAAIDAVSQWQYRPYILNDEPVEVETQITVNFTLN